MNNIELIKKIEKEHAFDSAYKKEFSAYISAAKELERLSGGKINFYTAKKLIQTRRSELIGLLKAL